MPLLFCAMLNYTLINSVVTWCGTFTSKVYSCFDPLFYLSLWPTWEVKGTFLPMLCSTYSLWLTHEVISIFLLRFSILHILYDLRDRRSKFMFLLPFSVLPILYDLHERSQVYLCFNSLFYLFSMTYTEGHKYFLASIPRSNYSLWPTREVKSIFLLRFFALPILYDLHGRSYTLLKFIIAMSHLINQSVSFLGSPSPPPLLSLRLF